MSKIDLKPYETVWVTSDLHFYHKNICIGQTSWENKGGCRPFQTVTEMNDAIISNINSQAGENDLIIHAGDFCFGNPAKHVPEIFGRLKCKNVVNIMGNHDYKLKSLCSNYFTSFQDKLSVRFEGLDVLFFHFPIESWEDMARGSIHLHGHSHGNLIRKINRRHDIGIDTNDFKMYNLSELITELNIEKTEKVDHH